ncbi:MAG: ABC transporter substrate-binding protein [Spirochaetales bacterium]
MSSHLLRRVALSSLLLTTLVGLNAAGTGATDKVFPLTLKDAQGTAITLSAAPKAIISLTLPTDEILIELVDQSRIKAIDSFATDAGISNIAAWAKAFPTKIAGEKEKIIALQPDLVFVASWKEPEFIAALREAKIPVFVFKTPDNFDELTTLVTQMAAVTGETAKGKALLATVEKRLAAVATKLKGVAAKPTVLSYSFWGSTYAKGTSFEALIEKAGLVNVATKAGLSGWPQVSKEQVLALDPDVILLPSWSYDGSSDAAKFLADFVADPVFAGLKAVKNKRVLVMQDKHLQSTSQYMADAVEDLAKAGYPALFR